MKKKIFVLGGTIILSLSLAGCFQGEQSMDEMDPPRENAEPVNNLEEIPSDKTEENKEAEDSSTAIVERELYLLDKNGMVAAQTLQLPETDQVASQVLEYLIKDGPVTELLPNGFQAVLPAGTEILGMNLLEDGTLIVDLSEEFKDYQPEEEVQILEAMTFTLTQFENVDRVQLWINGHHQEAMPVAGTPIGKGYSREMGINVMASNTPDLLTSEPVTMYYPQEQNENRYYVPVTQYIEEKDGNLYRGIIETLLDGPGYSANVKHVFNTNAQLLADPVLEDGVLSVLFNEGILKDSEKAVISDDVMETIVRTLTEQEGIEAVDIKVESVEQLVNEDGEVYEEPVSKQYFTPTEQL